MGALTFARAMDAGRLGTMAAVSRLVAATLASICGIGAGVGVSQAAPKTVDPRVLAESFFAAPTADRERILAELAPFDQVAAADVDGWRKSLIGWAVKHGPRFGGKAKAYLYEKPDRGLYLTGGKKGAEALLIALHGGGIGAGDAASAASAFGGAASTLGLRMVAPEVLEKTEHGWTDPPETERFVLDLIEATIRAEKLDRNRVVLTGHSMGGYGTWTLGAVHADLFAGLAVFAGAPTCTRVSPSAPISGVDDGILPNLRNLPIFVYQSGDDRNVPPESNDFALPELDRLAKADPGGYVHRYDRVEGRGHAFPEKGVEAGLRFATNRARDPRPKKTVWQPSRAWKTQFYGLYWDRPALGAIVTVEAKGANTFDVTASGPTDGLEILLDAKNSDLAQDVVVTSAGKEIFRGKAKPSLRTMLRTSQRCDPDLFFTASVPATIR